MPPYSDTPDIKEGNWSPIINSGQVGAARSAIVAIAEELERRFTAGREETSGVLWANSDTALAEGAAGVAVFFSYLDMAQLWGRARHASLEYLDFAIQALAQNAMTPSLFGGFSGIAWATQHMNDRYFHRKQDLCSSIDCALIRHLSAAPWQGQFDLVSGLVGIGTYALERQAYPSGRRCLETVIDRLGEMAERRGNEIRWFTPPRLIPATQKERYPNGNYNLGLAHGAPCVIGFLGRAYAAEVRRQKVRELLEGTVRWFLRQQLPKDACSSFPAVKVSGLKPGACRLAWCYGDAGVAAALLVASRCLGVPSWEKHALTIARRAALREPQTAGVKDACICHGSAGLAHVFNRLYQATRIRLFAEASRYWFTRTLRFRRPGEGIGGYLGLKLDQGQRQTQEQGLYSFQACPGLLIGAAGVGLALLSGISTVEPLWDRIFLLDIPSNLTK